MLRKSKPQTEILPYSLKHQQNHERCKELYPEGFKYVSASYAGPNTTRRSGGGAGSSGTYYN